MPRGLIDKPAPKTGSTKPPIERALGRKRDKGAQGQVEGSITPLELGHGYSVGHTFRTFLDEVEVAEKGLPRKAVGILSRSSGLSISAIHHFSGASRPKNRVRTSQRMSTVDSERVLRFARLFERARDLFNGDTVSALEWLKTPMPALGERSPIDLGRTAAGAREVEYLIGRIQYGVIS